MMDIVLGDISNTDRDSFCDDKNRGFLQLHRFLSSFAKLDRVVNVSDFTQRENMLCG